MRRLPLVLGAGLILIAPAAVAQDRRGAMEAKPSDSAWVKLCETPGSPSRDILGDAQVVGVKNCLTLHERLDAANGTRLLAVAVRQSGRRQTLTVVVPAGVDQAAGMRVLVYPHHLWERAQRREVFQKQEMDRLGVLKLKFSLCDARECTAETDATPEVINDLKSNAGLVAFALKSQQPVAFPIPLGGFREAHEGPPIDGARFHQGRSELLRKLRERQRGEQRQKAGQRGQ